MRIRTFDYKFPGMRKPDNFVIYPPIKTSLCPGDARYLIQAQGSRTICRFDPATRKGVLNFKGSNSKYGLHLLKMFGAIDYDFPEDFVKLCMDNVSLPGMEIGPGVTIGGE
jgi:hypothetical protein